jgi:hypothetical protein
MPAFAIRSGKARQLEPAAFKNEKELQTFFEENLETLLGVRLVATEFGTGEKHGGRIDSLGLDEADNPVIIEYKWDKSDSVINQGLFYLDWLTDHHGDFQVAAQERLGPLVEISWTGPRLIIVASNYTKFDSYAVNQLSTNIELLRYRRYSDGFLVVENVLDPLGAASKKKSAPAVTVRRSADRVRSYDLEYHLQRTSPVLRAAFLALRDRVLALDGVEERVNQKSQITYRTTKSFIACDFGKSRIAVQFKGGSAPPNAGAIVIKDIRSRQWGYPWLCNLTSTDEVDAVFEVALSAYGYEQ